MIDRDAIILLVGYLILTDGKMDYLGVKSCLPVFNGHLVAEQDTCFGTVSLEADGTWPHSSGTTTARSP